VDLVLPNNSVEAAIYSRRRDELAAAVFLPAAEAFTVGESKWLSWQRFRDAGLPVPRTELLASPADVPRVFEAIGTRPVWVRGAGIPGRGVGVASLPCRTAAQAEQWVEYWNGWGGMIASEFLPGDNLTWLGVFDRGALVASQGRQRDAYVIPHVSPSGITGAPAVCHTVHRADINTLGPRAVLAVDPGYTGPAFVDFKGDEQGVPRITEINVGRFGTTHHFYSVAGANFPLLVLALALGRPLPAWVRTEDVLPAGLYWIRTLDAGPVLVREEDL
jgi:carbamoyl-phosphate synthase large subunit